MAQRSLNREASDGAASLDKSVICTNAERSTVTAPAEADLHPQAPSRLAPYPSISQPIAPGPPLSTPAPQPRQQTVSRCLACRKRVGLLGFKCRCGDLFCATHRYSDKHGCSYDYRAAGRAAIAEQNPIVKASKIEKI